jgi:large subunit ribosomal protein L15
MKLHDLRPAEGARKPRTRVGRGIAAGKGKTAGRGTKGQKARTGGTIQPWFEGGQTPIHIRIPKLRGFRNKFRIEYEVVNVGRLSELAETGALDAPEIAAAGQAASKAGKGAKAGPVSITQEILAAVGLVRSLDHPLKVLGQGEVSRPLFVVADAFSKSARTKIEAAGGTAQVLEYPGSPGSKKAQAAEEPATKKAARKKAAKAKAEAEAPEAETESPKKKAPKAEAEAPKAEAEAPEAEAEAPEAEAEAPEAEAEAPKAEAEAPKAEAEAPTAEPEAPAAEPTTPAPDEASGAATDEDAQS